MRAIKRGTDLNLTGRVQQVMGMFDVPKTERIERTWELDIPTDDRDWQIGLIVGPSGSGKSTILGEIFGTPPQVEWPEGQAVVDGFPKGMKIQEITGALSAVGFSSPPAWLRSFSSLSNGEAFRATLARLLVEERDPILMDEFTSVVDRTVAKIASAAVAKYVRRGDHKLVVASCHYDVMDWLQPDWVYDTGGYEFTWRHLQPRPPIELEIYRSTPEAWRTFHHHHYLTGNLHKAATCLVALVEGRPAAFASALHRPHGKVKNLVGEHRTVCLPDFQGVGIGNALSEFLASVYIARGMRYRSTTSSPAMIRHRARSSLWRMERPPSMVRPQGKRAGRAGLVTSTSRLTSSFEYVGPQASDDQLSALNLTQGDNRGLG